MNNFIFLRSSRAFFVFSTLTCLIISGCTTDEPVVVEEPVVTRVVEPAWKNELRQLSIGQLEVNAVNALLRNDEQTALRNLTILLEYSPNSYSGLLLKKQIDSQPEEVLGSRFIVYPAIKGESLMSIAERFSGNRLNFYALAKFNKMSASDKITESALIQVPNKSPVGTVANSSNRRVTQPSRTPIRNQSTPLPSSPTIQARPTTQTEPAGPAEPIALSEPIEPAEPEVTEESIIEQANSLYSKHKYAELISLRNSNYGVFTNNPQLTDYVATSYMVLSEQAFAKKQMTASTSYLNEAKKFNLSGPLSSRASSLEAQLQINALLDKAKSQKQQGQLEQSLYTYQAIQSIAPDNAKANKERKSITNTLSKKYYQEAIVARGKFDYRSELSWINKILGIDPSHSKSLQRKPVVQRLVEQLN